MGKAEFRRLLDDLKHPEKMRQLCELIRRLYLEHGAAKRVAPVLGCTPAELGRLIANHPQVREARDMARHERASEELHALRRRLGLPGPEEKAASPAAASAPRRRRRGAGGPPLTMTLTLDVIGHVPTDSEDKDDKQDSARFTTLVE